MERISLDGKVAVVTGAGRGIGRGHALLLAERGASVVVNDLGSETDGSGSDSAVASEVVELIKSRGGRAVANAADISTNEGGRSLIQTAVDAFGGVDIVVNNAGIGFRGDFVDTPLETFERLWRIHLGGHVNVTQAAWPILSARGGGSVINTGSGGGMYGLPNGAAYSAAKGAVYGLTRALAIEGRQTNIRVNMICPGGLTRMFNAAKMTEEQYGKMERAVPVELVAPVVIWLASEACTMTGQTFEAWGGIAARFSIGVGKGYIDRDLTPEGIAQHIDDVVSPEALYEPTDGYDSLNHGLRLIGAE
ncbi:MAG: SDR family NAD(P)-dependent oxidoreductase [Devosia sp.]|jgi:NAD(P)-dependent dehydrogenase (short-subunit alcohol dehydrogenase family)|nr:SDR family NAD(P)-dependent oxidoreductase [Devosia sp.]